jgi:DNA-binding transcriptional LysR family regulator
MDLEARLRAFAAFARRGSFTAAAQEIRISQPAISKHIADVERETGVKLVERQPRGGALTPAGEFLANHVLRAQALLVQAVRGVAAFRQPATASLSLVASGVPGTYLLPDVVATFQREHPGVRISVEMATSARAVDALRSHRAEVGVVGGFAAAPEIDAEPLVEDEIVVVGPPQLAGRKMSLRDLESTTWISREEGSASRAAIEAAWADFGLTPHHRLDLPSWEEVKLAVSHGHGVAACSRFAIEGELQTGTLALIRLRGWSVRRTISIIRLREAALTPSAREFLTMLKARWSGTSPGRMRRSARRPTSLK